MEMLGKDDVEMGGQKGLASATQWSAVPLACKCPISERRGIGVGTEAK